MDEESVTPKKTSLKKHFGIYVIITFVVIQAIATITYVAMFSMSIPEDVSIPKARVFAILSMIGSMAILIGGGLGFLFSLPRIGPEYQDRQYYPYLESENKSEHTNSNQKKQYRINTNLELVSDWLTKILVGVGLTQLHNLNAFLISMSEHLSKDMNEIPSIQPMITLVIVVWFTLAFFSIYLLTRLSISLALIEADADADVGIDKSKLPSLSSQETDNIDNLTDQE